MQKTVIFDLDGTIADTFNYVFDIANSHAEGYGFRKVDPTDIEKYRGMTIRQIFKEFNVPFWKLPFIARKIMKELKLKITSAKTFKTLPQTLKVLTSSGYRLMILTSNTETNTAIFLSENKLNMFEYIQTGSSLFGKSKYLNRILKKFDLNSDEVVYIGDEVRDLEAARKSGIPFIAVCWGFNNKEILTSHKPDQIAETPKQLPEKIHQVLN